MPKMILSRNRLVLSLCLAVLLLTHSISHAGDLRTITTKHYRIDTDLDAELAADCAERMDAMYDEYARRFSAVADFHNAPPLQVYLFTKRAGYLNRVGVTFQNTGGLFVPSQQFLATFLEGQGRDSLRRTLQHEAFHQFAHQVFPNELPPWLNEGMAQIFEEGLWTGHEFWIGQVPPRRVRQLQADIKSGRLLDFSAMGLLSPQQWAQAYNGDSNRAKSQYDQAWAMIYFLMHAKDSAGHESYRPRLFQLLQLLHDGTGATDAFTRTFPDAPKVQSAFVAYLAGLQPTPEALLIDRQATLADLMIELNTHKADLRSALSRGKYRLRYVQGDVRWESDASAKSYFNDLAGNPFSRGQLFLHARPSAPLPDVVCKCFDQYELRTRFHQQGNTIEHEIVIEPVHQQRATTVAASR
jgi:hypothetical protein